MSTNELATMIQNAVKQAIVSGSTETSSRASLEAEQAKLKAELATLTSPKKPYTATPAAFKGSDASDKMLLSIVKKFQGQPRKDGKPTGTFAVKVHSYFHSAGYDESTVSGIVKDAINRRVISNMTVPTKNGNRMMLYFAYTDRPVDRVVISDTERQALLAAFGSPVKA